MNISGEQILQYLRDHPNVNRADFATAIGMNKGNLISAINKRRNTSGGLYRIPGKYLDAARREIGKLQVRKGKSELEKEAAHLAHLFAYWFGRTAGYEGDKIKADERFQESIVILEKFKHVKYVKPEKI